MNTMTVENTVTDTQATDPINVLAKLASFFKKSVSDAALKDIEQIVSVVDDHVEPNRMPTKTEVDTAPGQEMRGFAAPRMVAAHSNLLPQEGLAEMYEKFDAMMAGVVKAMTDSAVKNSKDIVALRDVVKGIADSFVALQKAAEEEKNDLDKTRAEKDSAEDVAAKALAVRKAAKNELTKSIAVALRKARIAIRKAEDMDEEEEDKEEMMEKATNALAALNTAVSKAEEDEEMDDEDEKMAEKARGDYRALKGQVKKIVAKMEKSATKTATPVVTKDDITAALTEFATSKSISVADVFAAMGQKPTMEISEPPTFAKAITDKVLTPAILASRIEDAADAGILKDKEISKADSLKLRLGMVQAGRYDANALMNEINLASPAIQSLFALPQAA